MFEGSRFDRCRWRKCEAECVDEIQLCWYHFRLIGETFMEKRSLFGSVAVAQHQLIREQEAASRPPAQPHEDWLRSRSVVYYVRINDYVKIGYTAYLRDRVGSLRVAFNSLLAVEPGARHVESQRHEQFASERQGRRENFNPSRRLLTHVEAMRVKHGEPWSYSKRRVVLAGPEVSRKIAL